jgi:exosortase
LNSRLGLAGLLGVSVFWSCWPMLCAMSQKWSHDPRYSHGVLVPMFALALLWLRRQRIAAGSLQSSWWGVLLIGAGSALQIAGAYVYIDWVSGLALLPYLAGLCALVGGGPLLRRAWPSIAFLFFMIPLPYAVEVALGQPLQRVATMASTYGLQTLGLPALAEGNTIVLGDARIGIVEACNGLGILFTFIAIATAVALVVSCSLVEKVLMVLSAVPIALVANVTRITVTGLLHETVGGKVADAVYHDLAGWLMMPFALAMLWIEGKIFSHLLVEADTAGSLAPRLAMSSASTRPIGEPSNGRLPR